EDRSFAAHQELLAESSAQHRDFLSGRDKLKEQFGEISARRKALLLAANGEQKARLTEAYDAMMSRAKAGYLDDAFARLEDFRRLMEEVEDELEQERQLVVDNLQDLVEAAERTLESLDGGLIGMERDELAERLGLAREAAEQGKKATCEQALAALQEQLDRATGQQVLAEELMVRRSTYPARVEAAEEHAEGHTGLVAAIHRVWENADQAPTEQDWDGLQKALDTLDTLLETLRALKEGEAKDEEAARQQAEAKKQAEQAQKAAAQAAKAAQRQAEVADGMSWGDAYFAGQSALLQKIWGETKKVAGTNNTLGGIPGKYPIDVIRDAIAVWDGTSPNRPGLTGMHVPGKDVQDKSRKMKAGGQNAGRKGSEGCFISTWHGVNYNIHVKVAGT
ncbi:MAG TPA: hypothetical protein PLA94_14695, partial [Myxococcota bacterium]|nr:hypothetical protein [Myxococcota bacterium]